MDPSLQWVSFENKRVIDITFADEKKILAVTGGSGDGIWGTSRREKAFGSSGFLHQDKVYGWFKVHLNKQFSLFMHVAQTVKSWKVSQTLVM